MAFPYNQPSNFVSGSSQGNMLPYAPAPAQPQGMMPYGNFNPQQMQQFMMMQSMLKDGKTSASTPSAPSKKKYVQRKDRPDIRIRLASQGGIDYDFHLFDKRKLKFTVPEIKLINPDDPSKGNARRGEVLYNYGTEEVPNWKPFKLEGPMEVLKYGVGERDKTEKVDGVDKPTGEKTYSVVSYIDTKDPEHVLYMKVLAEVYIEFCRWCYLEPKCGMKSMVDVNTINFEVFNHEKPCTNVKSVISPEKDKTPEKNIIHGGLPREYSKCNPYGEYRCIFTDSSDPPEEIDLDVINNSIVHGWCLRSFSNYSIQGQGPSASIIDRFQSMVVDNLEEKGRTHQQSSRINKAKNQGEQKNIDLKDQIAQIKANIQLHKKQVDDLKSQFLSTTEEKSEEVRPRDFVASSSSSSSSSAPTNIFVEPTGRGAFYMEDSSAPPPASSRNFVPPQSLPPTTPADINMQVNTFAPPSQSGAPSVISFNPQQQEYYAKMAAAQQQSQNGSNISSF